MTSIRQARERLGCLSENVILNKFRKTVVLKKQKQKQKQNELLTKATQQRILLNIFGAVPVPRILQALALDFSFLNAISREI